MQTKPSTYRRPIRRVSKNSSTMYAVWQELWGFNKAECLEVIQKFLKKYSLKLKMSAPTVMVYLETGYLPIETEIDIKVIAIWISLLTGTQDKFSYKLYIMCLSLYKRGLIIFKWMDNVVKILNTNGFSDVFREQLLLDVKYLKNIFLPEIKTTIRDQAVQALFEKINKTEFFIL